MAAGLPAFQPVDSGPLQVPHLGVEFLLGQGNRAAAEEASKAPKENDELVRLRKENEGVLRLRNEVRQLREDKQQLTRQVQSAQAQAQSAQAQAAFKARYGLPASATEQEKGKVCISNLQQIDGAKQQWALENKKTADAIPAATDLAPYLKNGMPACPAGGAYTLNAAGVEPTCTIPGHALPK